MTAGNPTARPPGSLLQWFADGGGRDTTRAEEGAVLLLQWTRECMAIHGWDWQPGPSGDPRS
ncbi:DUF6300 family protein [Streptomyces sp. NPDC059071]|uniref:DUF6300 family protein n=1 Tax=unclassified Streptomyces TaxID=2593676 RepID=UPI0036549ACB